MDVDGWLGEGDAPEADWASFILKRALRGQLGRGGKDLLVDLVALGQPYACDSGRCAPGGRAPRSRSCCADLDVSLAPEEVAAIEAAMPEIRAQMADDPRWAGEAPAWIDDGVLRRPGRRCVFARQHEGGLRCALHEVEDARGAPRGTIKPMPCRLFPLAIVDLGDGRRLLTAIHRATARHLVSRPARAFPCLGAGPPLVESERATLTELFGQRVWQRIRDAVAGAG
jgi:hypothetical protein